MLKTTNYALKKPEGTDVVNVQDFNDNADVIDIELKKLNTSLSDMVYQIAGGTATVLTLTIKGTLVNGYPITFIASANNGGAGTTINGKPLYKPGTTTAPTLIGGKAYTIWYNSASSCFFIKASAEGNTVASHVLAGETFSNDTDTGLIGTMVDRSLTGDDYLNSSYPTLRINKGGAIQYGSYGTTSPANRLAVCPPIGWYPGGGGSYVTMEASEVASALGLTAAKILSGNTVCNIAGTATNDAVLDPKYLLAGYSGYDDGVLKQGTMQSLNPTWGDQWEATGTSVGAWSYNSANNYAYLQVPAGYYLNGVNWIFHYEPNLYADRIISGNTIMGVAGTATLASLGGKTFVSGSYTKGTLSITLPFAPQCVIARCNDSYGKLGYELAFWMLGIGSFLCAANSSTYVLSPNIPSVSGNVFTPGLDTSSSMSNYTYYAWSL